LNLHLLHQPVAMSFNGTLGHAELMGDMLVGLAANDKLEDLAFARRQCSDVCANDVELLFVSRVAS
jgi:hypothetical protein